MKIMINNTGDKERKIVVFNEEEKQKRRILREELEKYIEFPESVYSYIKGKSRKRLIQNIEDNINYYRYVVKIDILNYFESINYNILRKILIERSNELLADRVIALLEDEMICTGVKGLALGSPLNNFLSNLYLINLDTEMEKLGIEYYRFCDDIIILTDFKEILEDIASKLMELELTINRDKTTCLTKGEFKYLGQNFYKEEFVKDVALQESNLIDAIRDLSYIDVCNKYGGIAAVVYKIVIEGKNKESVFNKLIEERKFNVIYTVEEILRNIAISNNDLVENMRIFIQDKEYFYKWNKVDEEYIKCTDLNMNVINDHLKGKEQIAVETSNVNKESRLFVIDIDSKPKEKAYEDMNKISAVLDERDISYLLEDTGGKGYHIWIFFTQYINIETLDDLFRKILDEIDLDGSNIEVRPRVNGISESENIIRLPLGIHPKTGARSELLNIGDLENVEINIYKDFEVERKNKLIEIKELYPKCYKIYNKCSILKNIIDNALIKGEMGHFNRLLLSYIYPYIDEGEAFIHYILKDTNKYSYNITEKYINKAPTYPISCNKICSYFRGSNLVELCNCTFNIDGFYNTPLLHSNDLEVIKLSITNEIKDIVSKILRIIEEQKRLDKEKKVLEDKLERLYEKLNITELDVNNGKLKKREDKWIIEIEV